MLRTQTALQLVWWPPRGNMSIDVELTDLAYGGDAVGRYEGRVLFVPGGIPGERVRVEIVEERRGHARADLLEILREIGVSATAAKNQS